MTSLDEWNKRMIAEDQATIRRINALREAGHYRLHKTDEGWELQRATPLPRPFDWVTMAGPGSQAYCLDAADTLREGESPLNYDDYLGEKEENDDTD
jgi:hypothetical protein